MNSTQVLALSVCVSVVLAACAPTAQNVADLKDQILDPIFAEGQIWEVVYPDRTISNFTVGKRDLSISKLAFYPISKTLRFEQPASFMYSHYSGDSDRISINTSNERDSCFALFKSPLVRSFYVGYYEALSEANTKVLSSGTSILVTREYTDIVWNFKSSENYNGLLKCTMRRIK